MGTVDRVVRILAAVLIVILYFTNVVTGLWALVLLGFAAIFVATSFVSFCPLYLPFGIFTFKKQNKTNS